MSSTLTPDQLLFQSFRHSQGHIGPQLHIFRYMDLRFGIGVDLHPAPQNWQQFTKYIDGVHAKDTHAHLKMPGYEKVGASKAVYKAFKDIRGSHNARYGKKV